MVRELDADHLAAVLLLERHLDVGVEAFRCKPALKLTVSFASYTAFVSTCLGKKSYLSRDTKVLQTLARSLKESDTKALYRAYLFDIGCAVAKEVFIAHELGKEATSIVHTKPTTESVQRLFPSAIALLYGRGEPQTQLAESMLRQRMQDKGYTLPKYDILPPYLRTHYAYAVWLVRSSITGTVWELA